MPGVGYHILEIWTSGYGGMSRKEALVAKKKFAEDEAARNEHVGVVDDLRRRRREGWKDAPQQKVLSE